VNLEALRWAYLRRVVATGLGALGPHRSLRIARALARGVCDLNPPGRRTAEERLARAFGPDLTAVQRDAIVRTMYEHIAAFWVEALFLPRMLRPRTWRRAVRFAGAPGPRQLAEMSGPCVLATCYFGNIAAAAYALGQVCRPLYVLVDYLAHPAARAWQDRLYRAENVRPLPTDRAARRLPDLLRGGAKVLTVIEHRRRRGGVRATFLGEQHAYQPTVGRLAEWFGAPVLPVLCRRLPQWGQFELWLGGLIRGPDVASTLTEVLQRLDAQVRRWPEQYLWSLSPPDSAVTETESETPAAPRTR